MAVLLYKDALCQEPISSYEKLLDDLQISIFSSGEARTDYLTIYAKNEGAEQSAHFGIGLIDTNLTGDNAALSPEFLSATVGQNKAFSTVFTKVGDMVYECVNANLLSVGDFISPFNNPSKISQISAINGNQITLSPNWGLEDENIRAFKLIPLGDTAQAVEITIQRNISYALANILPNYAYSIFTFWE